MEKLSPQCWKCHARHNCNLRAELVKKGAILDYCPEYNPDWGLKERE